MSYGVCASAIFMHTGSDIVLGREDLLHTRFLAPPHQDGAPFFRGATLQPIDLIPVRADF
jgi:hypothetical protein